MSSINLLYIAGYSRCGSTALAMALDQHADLMNLGEVSFFVEDYGTEHRMCSCQETYPSCSFWSSFADEVAVLGDVAPRVDLESNRNFRSLLTLTTSEECIGYGRAMKSFLSKIREVSGKPVLLDASKTARGTVGRALALHRFADQKVGLLHLVRDPRSTIRSYMDHGSNWALEDHVGQKKFSGLRALVGWIKANRAVDKTSQAAPEIPIIRIRYEDLTSEPNEQLSKIADAFGLDMSRVTEAISTQIPLEAGHSVGGNRTRFAARPFETMPCTSTPTIPLFHTLVLKMFAGDLLKKYGYEV